MALATFLKHLKPIRSRLLPTTSFARKFCSDDCGDEKKGLILGVYESESSEPIFTKAAAKFNDHLNGKIYDLIIKDLSLGKKPTSYVFHNLDKEFWAVALVNLGSEKLCYNELEEIDEALEAVRCAAGTGAQVLKAHGITRILVEGMGHPEQAAEGCALALWRYQENRSRQHWKIIPTLELFDDSDCDSFQRGLFKAESQNLCRRLSDTPSNQMTPLHFAQEAVNELCPCGIKVMVHDRDWVESKKMNGFLMCARGSCEPPVVVEVSYCGAGSDQKPILLVGKGVTFDSGGLCLKHCECMDKYRADMSGAATVIAAIRAASAMCLPLNIEAVLPLCENMPSGMAVKPGDVCKAMNGRSVMITDTDCEGRVILADAFYYGQCQYKPRLVVDVSTLSPGMRIALGEAAAGVFTNSSAMWTQVKRAGVITGDRVWRMPLWKIYSHHVTDFSTHDVNNKGKGYDRTCYVTDRGMGAAPSCLAAAFLNEFIECVDWVHFDTGGVAFKAETKYFPYLTKGRMTGRPTRTLIQLLHQLACPEDGQSSIGK